MTNREIAERLVAAVKRCQVKGKCDTCASLLEKAMRDAGMSHRDAAERSGKIDVIGAIITGKLSLLNLTEELARLRAEEGK